MSSDEQVRGSSLDSQQSSCEEYCRRNDMQVVKVFREEGERSRMGMLRIAERGGWNFKAPLGYVLSRAPDGLPILAIDPITGPLVVKLFEALATGRRTTVSVRLYSKDLGLRAPCGRPLHEQTLHKMLRNDVYAGRITGVLLNGKTIKAAFPGLVTEDFMNLLLDIKIESSPLLQTFRQRIIDEWTLRHAEVIASQGLVKVRADELLKQQDALLDKAIRGVVDDAAFTRKNAELTRLLMETRVDYRNAAGNEFDIEMVIKLACSMVQNAGRLWYKLQTVENRQRQHIRCKFCCALERSQSGHDTHGELRRSDDGVESPGPCRQHWICRHSDRDGLHAESGWRNIRWCNVHDCAG